MVKVKALRNVSYQGLSLAAGSVMDIPQEVYVRISSDVELIEGIDMSIPTEPEKGLKEVPGKETFIPDNKILKKDKIKTKK